MAELLRGRIVAGQIAPGTHLVEDAVAVEHGISRGPVRDALRILTGEGLLESRRRGFFVRGFTQVDIDELYQIREAAEQLAGRLALQRAATSDWDDARHYVDVMRSTADAGDRHAYAVADLAFHTQFYVLSGNARLESLWRQFQPTFAALLDVTNAQDLDLHPSADDHVTLMQLAEAGDVAGFATTLTDHLAGSRRRMSQSMAARTSLVAIS
ncbi:GntR family transcriptional regulator [Mariniluteicoccus flavus]